MKLKKVYQAKDEIDTSLIMGFLESNGIKAVSTQSSDNMPPFMSGEGRSMSRHMVPQDIYVPEDVAAEAEELIKSVR